ncbi:MAG TPA: hypothetical protein VIP77_24890 [Jiangellaceae bacterium]
MNAQQPESGVAIMCGYPNQLLDAWVMVMALDPPRICLGVDEADGSETTAWYWEGDVVTASGRRWSVGAVGEVGADPSVVLSPAQAEH